MISGPWHRLDMMGRSLIPVVVTIFLMLVSQVPTRLPGFAFVVPALTLMSVYYWSIHRPDLMRPAVVFGIGLLQDLLSGMPLGMNALTLLLVHGVILSQRQFFLANNAFALLWWAFGLIMLGAMAVQWLAFSLLNLYPFPVYAALFQMLLTLSLFPPFAWFFIRLHRLLLTR